MFLYGLLYGFFKRVEWKWGWLRRLGVISTPILDGTWSGTVQSDYDGVTRPAHVVEVIIGQDWTGINIRLLRPESNSSKSHSLSASMVVTEDECILIYDYLNEPNSDAPATMHMIEGPHDSCSPAPTDSKATTTLVETAKTSKHRSNRTPQKTLNSDENPNAGTRQSVHRKRPALRRIEDRPIGAPRCCRLEQSGSTEIPEEAQSACRKALEKP